ncbi:hypothetical protein CYK37_07595 [Mesorhizobium loti]|nr:RDD family protein [Mesorhizobium loti]PLP60030.1 hypothetical protein CYK37_07595 [Mesorhizobium loti]
MTDTESPLLRAGFWRRLAALVIDTIVIFLPLQILVAILFAQTNGNVQGGFFVVTECQSVGSLPEGLQPPPPADANFANLCTSRFFGFPTAHVLSVGTTTQKGNTTTSRSINYPLDADGKPTNALDMSWVALLVLTLYLIAMEWRSGATVGKRLLKMKVINAGDTADVGIPLSKAVKRNLAIWVGAIPALLIFVKLIFFSADPLAAMSSSGFLLAAVVAFLIQAAWMIWIVVSVSKKSDPIYDRIARTSLVKLR